MARKERPGSPATEAAWQEVQKKIPGVMLRNRSSTTASIYAKTPDGHSLRIGDHKGKERWAYRWNLRLDLKSSFWMVEVRDGRRIPRFYTPSVDELAREVGERTAKETGVGKGLALAIAALEEIENGTAKPRSIAVIALREIYRLRKEGAS